MILTQGGQMWRRPDCLDRGQELLRPDVIPEMTSVAV